jgi:hypothetical protein
LVYRPAETCAEIQASCCSDSVIVFRTVATACTFRHTIGAE